MELCRRGPAEHEVSRQRGEVPAEHGRRTHAEVGGHDRGDVSATPAVDNEKVYFPDWAGNLSAVDKGSGGVVWQKKISDYTGNPVDKARATPAFTDSTLVIGNQGPFGGGGAIIAINKANGALL